MHDDKINGIDKWQVESDLRTCEDYKSIFADSSRLKAVKTLAIEKMDTLADVALGKDMGHDESHHKDYGKASATHKLN